MYSDPLTVTKQAIQHLAALCDGAHQVDGVGFSKIHVEFGKSLAAQDTWSPKQTKAALHLVRRYRKQLTNGGFNVEDLLAQEIDITKPKAEPKPATKKPKKIATLDGNVIRMVFPYDPSSIELVKTIPGRRFQSKEPKHWTAPVSRDAVKILHDADFQLDQALKDVLNKPTTTVEDVPDIPLPELKRELFPFQAKGVSFIESRNGRMLLADEMGLGKTTQAIAWAALHEKKRPIIIVCPQSLKLKWREEIINVLPNPPAIEILSGSKPQNFTLLENEIYIINYDILSKWVPHLKKLKPQILVLDEAHRIKNNSAQRTQAAKKLAKDIPHLLALTGTPVVNRPIEVFNVLSLIDPTLFPDWFTFVKRYCGARDTGFGWDVNGATNTEELHKKLVESVMLRRRKCDVLKDLPPKLYSFTPLELDNQEAYREAEADFIRYIRETKGAAAARRAQGAEDLVRIQTLKNVAIQGKMKAAIQWIQEFLDEPTRKLVVFAIHKEPIDRIMAHFGDRAVKIDGSVSAKDRHKAEHRFQTDPSIQLFVGNIQAAGVGLTLTASSAVAFIELPWTPGDLAQATDRCHRIGQTDTVNVYYLLADKTIEYKLAAIIDHKRAVLDMVTDGQQVEKSALITELIAAYR